MSGESNWDEAMRRCDEILAQRPDDGPAQHLRARAEGYHEEPPPPGWTGSYRAVRK